MPNVAMHLERYVRQIQKDMNKEWQHTFSKISPYVLRHTFCTNMQRRGIDTKSLHYLMRHSNVGVTLDVYLHGLYHNRRCIL